MGTRGTGGNLPPDDFDDFRAVDFVFEGETQDWSAWYIDDLGDRIGLQLGDWPSLSSALAGRTPEEVLPLQVSEFAQTWAGWVIDTDHGSVGSPQQAYSVQSDGQRVQVYTLSGQFVSEFSSQDSVIHDIAVLGDQILYGTADDRVGAIGIDGVQNWQISVEDSLPVRHISAVEGISVHGKDYVIVASHGTDSLSVLDQSQRDITISDHIVDNADTRIAGVSYLNAFYARDKAYVFAAGEDAGYSLFQLTSEGRLVLVQSSGDDDAFQYRRTFQWSTFATNDAVHSVSRQYQDSQFYVSSFEFSDVRTIPEPHVDYGTDVTLFSGSNDRDVFVLGDDQHVEILGFDPHHDVIDLSAWSDFGHIGQLQFSTAGDDLIAEFQSRKITLSGMGEHTLAGTELGWFQRVDHYSASLNDRQEASVDPNQLSLLPETVLAMPVDIPNMPEIAVDYAVYSQQPDVTPAAFDIGRASNTAQAAQGGQSVSVMAGTYLDDAIISGRHGDIILGHSGSDFIRGNGGNDSLIGGSGDDQLFGGLGDDIVNGGRGNDLMYGGHGADQFVFSYLDGAQHDRVMDFDPAQDRVVLQAPQGQIYDFEDILVTSTETGMWLDLFGFGVELVNVSAEELSPDNVFFV